MARSVKGSGSVKVEGLGDSSGKMRPPPYPIGMYAVQVEDADDTTTSTGGHTMIKFTYKILGVPNGVDFGDRDPLGKRAYETIFIPQDMSLAWGKRNVDKYKNRVNAAGLEVDDDAVVGGIKAFVGTKFALMFNIRPDKEGEPQQDYGRAVPLNQSDFAPAKPKARKR